MLRRLAGAAALSLAALAAVAQPAPAARIVSTAPSITDVLFALGLGPRVVGVTGFCRYPEAARRLPRIGSFLEPDTERIFALRPTLVLILKNPLGITARLRGLGLNAVEVNHETMEGIYASLEIIGREAGVAEAAARLAAAWRDGLAAVRREAAGRASRRVVIIVGRTPGAIEGLVAAGHSSYLNELLEAAGGRNIFTSATAPYFKVSLEEILARNPDVLLEVADTSHAEGVPRESEATVRRLWARFPVLAAASNGRVFTLASDAYLVPGSRMVDAARGLRRLIYPEAGR